jgi:hypothetical protein
MIDYDMVAIPPPVKEAQMETIKVTMGLEKETKNTFKFSVGKPDALEGSRKPVCSEVYLQKSHFKGQQPPQLITVTVEG